MDNMVTFEVGKENPVKRQGMFIQADENGFTLFVTMDNLTKEEIEGCKSGSISLDLVYLKDIIFFVNKIQGFEVSDASFVANISDFRPIEPIEDGSGYPFHIILTESTTNIIQAIRLISLGTKFSKELNKCIKEQLSKPFDTETYNKNFASIMASYSSKQLAKFSTIHTKVRK